MSEDFIKLTLIDIFFGSFYGLQLSLPSGVFGEVPLILDLVLRTGTCLLRSSSRIVRNFMTTSGILCQYRMSMSLISSEGKSPKYVNDL